MLLKFRPRMRLKLCKSIFEGFFGRNSIEERKKILIISTIIAAMKGIFESMFDLNHDGNISPLESAMEFTFLNELLKDDSEVQTELELSGLDPDELEFMDADERREALEDAGLDPDEYDF